MNTLQQLGRAAKEAAYTLSTARTSQKNAALEAIASLLTQRSQEWISANAIDIKLYMWS